MKNKADFCAMLAFANSISKQYPYISISNSYFRKDAHIPPDFYNKKNNYKKKKK